MWKLRETQSYLPSKKSLSQSRDIRKRSWPSWITVGSFSATSLVWKWIHWYQNTTSKILPVYYSFIKWWTGSSDKYMEVFAVKNWFWIGFFSQFISAPVTSLSSDVILDDPTVISERQLCRLISRVWDKLFWFGKKDCVSFIKDFRIFENLKKKSFGCSLPLSKKKPFNSYFSF